MDIFSSSSVFSNGMTNSRLSARRINFCSKRRNEEGTTRFQRTDNFISRDTSSVSAFVFEILKFTTSFIEKKLFIQEGISKALFVNHLHSSSCIKFSSKERKKERFYV